MMTSLKLSKNCIKSITHSVKCLILDCIIKRGNFYYSQPKFGAETLGFFNGISPAFRFNSRLTKTTAKKPCFSKSGDFHFTRAKRTGGAIGAKESHFVFLPSSKKRKSNNTH